MKTQSTYKYSGSSAAGQLRPCLMRKPSKLMKRFAEHRERDPESVP